MFDKIVSRLNDVEKEYNVKILYAIESGSRIWGFESQDSDWDVRFIYIRKPEWYLTIGRLYNGKDYKDSIEIGTDENEIDIAGWDLSKALFLLTKTNCPLMEWLDSDIVYVSNDTFLRDIRAVATAFYSRSRSMFHYYHMTKGNVIEYLGDRELVWTKKYLYILRTLMCCLWIENFKVPAPVKFMDVLHVLVDNCLIPMNVYSEISKLISRKKSGEELGKQPPIELLNNFIKYEMSRLEGTLHKYQSENIWGPDEMKSLNNLFQHYIEEQ